MNRSEQLFNRAQQVIPGGVNSPVRAFRAVGGKPLFIERGNGSHIWDADGKEYIDYVGSWGPLIFGHRPPEVLKALTEVLEFGTSFGAPTEREVEIAELIVRDGSFRSKSPAGQFGYRSHPQRNPSGSRIHRPRPDHKIRRLLSRAWRQSAGKSGFRRRDPGLARQSGRSREPCGTDNRFAV